MGRLIISKGNEGSGRQSLSLLLASYVTVTAIGDGETHIRLDNIIADETVKRTGQHRTNIFSVEAVVADSPTDDLYSQFVCRGRAVEVVRLAAWLGLPQLKWTPIRSPFPNPCPTVCMYRCVCVMSVDTCASGAAHACPYLGMYVCTCVCRQFYVRACNTRYSQEIGMLRAAYCFTERIDQPLCEAEQVLLALQELSDENLEVAAAFESTSHALLGSSIDDLKYNALKLLKAELANVVQFYPNHQEMFPEEKIAKWQMQAERLPTEKQKFEYWRRVCYDLAVSGLSRPKLAKIVRKKIAPKPRAPYGPPKPLRTAIFHNRPDGQDWHTSSDLDFSSLRFRAPTDSSSPEPRSTVTSITRGLEGITDQSLDSDCESRELPEPAPHWRDSRNSYRPGPSQHVKRTPRAKTVNGAIAGSSGGGGGGEEERSLSSHQRLQRFRE